MPMDWKSRLRKAAKMHLGRAGNIEIEIIAAISREKDTITLGGFTFQERRAKTCR